MYHLKCVIATTYVVLILCKQRKSRSVNGRKLNILKTDVCLKILYYIINVMHIKRICNEIKPFNLNCIKVILKCNVR